VANHPDTSSVGVPTAAGPAALSAQLDDLRREMRRRHVESSDTFERVHPSHRQSAANLVDYLTLRRHDIRQLQESLAELGLSSLGRSQEHVITTVERVLDTLDLLTANGWRHRTEAAVSYGGGRETLEANATALLGPSRAHRQTRILVTMPGEAATDFELVRSLIDAGMDCARINCAHDDVPSWLRMVENLRDAAKKTGRPCPVLMDLPGPKLRTGPIEPGPRVLRLRPRRDAWGRCAVPAQALLVDEDRYALGASSAAEGALSQPGGRLPSAAGAVPVIPVLGPWLGGLRAGDRIRLRDTRDSPRTMRVSSLEEAGARIEVDDTTYLEAGTRLVADHGEGRVGLLAPRVQALDLRPGDVLTLTADLAPASPGVARIGCTLAPALDAVRVGHRVFLDDGKIGGVVVDRRPGEADVRITLASPEGTKLRAEKGINFPDSDLRLPALAPEDDALLRLIVEQADLVGLSFAQDATDVITLQRRLHELGAAHLGIVLKVETARGFSALPEMLLAGMASERVGVMVARGDLAVECGFERLAEVQEEMLWLCDAAHVPVIWATQVLDQMARTGQPSRAEISDAAMGGRAECVMLNKGPHIVDAVASLDDILGRMVSHQRKNVALLRRLRSWSPGR